MESQIVAETDYVREADHIEFFKTALKPLEFAVVPDVYRDCSTDRVLTMSVVAGQHLDAFLAKHPSQRLRDFVGSRLLELFTFQLLMLEVPHADPGKTLTPGAQRAVADFALRFYRKVYPPDPKDAERAFDFSDPDFLRNFLRAAGKLTRARPGTNPEYVFMVRAEVGLYTTLHRLKARVRTSAIVRRLLTE